MSQSDSTVFIVREESDLNHAYDFAEELLKVSGDLEIEIGPYKPKRSVPANRYYWELLTQAGEQSGHTKDELHALMRWKFLGAKQTEVMGNMFNLLPTTTDLNTKEFSEYVKQTETYILESGFTIKACPYYEDIWR